MNPTRERTITSAPERSCPYPLELDPTRLGLRTTVHDSMIGAVHVRHGRRAIDAEEPDGVATILLHGAAGSWSTWTPLITELDRRDESLTDVIAIDLPGWGESPLPRGRGASVVTIESLALVVAGIARELGYERWRILGHSLGGVVALEIAATEQRATVAVGLVSPTTFAVAEASARPIRALALVPAFVGMLGIMRFLAVLGPVGRSLVRTIGRAGLLRAVVSPLFAEPAALDRSVLEALAEEIRPRSFSLGASRLAAYPAREQWSRIRCAVRSAHGVRDVFLADSDAYRMRDTIADHRARSVAGAGHFAHIERPDAVAGILSDVLDARG